MSQTSPAQTQLMSRIEHSLDRLNATLSSLVERIPTSNSWETREDNFYPPSFEYRDQIASREFSTLNSEDFHSSFTQSLDLASQALQRFSQNSKFEINDLAQFISNSMSQINFGNLLTDPLHALSRMFTAKAHSGGFINDLALPFQSDEVPIIAKRGEAIFTPEQLNNAENILQNAKETGDQITINIHNHAAKVDVQAEQQSTDSGETNIDIVISEAENLMARRIALGSGLASAIESRYGVMPRARGGN